ncbi:MAG: hypothetical protein ACXVUL_01720 [Solirubrobacteraceae bacterium]
MRWGPAIGASLMSVCLAALGLAPSAIADRAFTPRFSTNASGDIAIVGNTLETCQAAAADCASARKGDGSSLNNNSFVMERVDVDRTMFDSSSARLSLPAGARVLFAGLYYGARTTAGTKGKAAPDPSPAGLRTVDLKLPGAARFERLTAAVDQSSEVTGAYGAFVDVTGQVRGSGSGVYTVANVQAATGEDRYAGWALVVAYEAFGDPPRNLTVFDGLQSVTQSKPALTIPVSGFQTPLSGPVRTKLGFVAYEGDRGLTGDSATLDGKALSDAVNPANNLFNSAISVDGRNLTDKTPDYVNQLGFDAKLIRIDGTLANGATSAKIALRTSSDQYLPHVITFATDLYAPVIRATKSVENLTHHDGPTRGGDTLRYTVTYTNEGLEAATNFVAVDHLPSNATYLAGTLRISGVPAGQPLLSDAAGDDLGEYDASQHTVRFFLGNGATPGRGGDIAIGGAPGDRAQISFDVRVDPNDSAESEIKNVALATFIAPTLNRELSAISSETITSVSAEPRSAEPADLALAQSETVAPSAFGDDAVDDHVAIENHGPGDATDVVFHDVVPPGATIESATTDMGSCSISATEVTCVIHHLDSGGTAEVNVVIVEPPGDAMAGSTNEASVIAAQFDPTPANASNDATAAMPASTAPMADLSIVDHESSQTVPLGGTITDTITVINHGPGTATAVDLTDGLTAAAELVAVNPGGASCNSSAPLHCTFPSLAPGESFSVGLRFRELRPGRVINAASVSADDAEPNYANDFAKAAATVRRRSTAAKVRIVPVQPVVAAGHSVGFVVTVGVTRRTPGVLPKVCVSLPRQLKLRAAPGAMATGSRLCWELGDLVSGRPRTFRFTARVGSAVPAGGSVAVPARLTGANFAATRARAVFLVPRAPTGCASRARAAPLARIAC